MPYAGKSVLSRLLTERYGFGNASVDDEIIQGKYDVTQMTQQDWNDVYSRAFQKLENLLKGGQTVIFDGAGLRYRERQSLRNTATECGAGPVLIYVNTSPEEIVARRLKNMSTQTRAHLKDETMRQALSMFEEPTPDEHPIIYNAGLDLEHWIEKNIAPRTTASS